ncbi:hypothetical protein CEXT_101771 [Caerostris extrusa]|uniref:Uncharacterized protein n=1 Tax=Caerostris extrusa TaxID=172846 RepID=A0AAV4P2M5_CAEEX|nr:hypothetical protein CEXT_101771 [Caerostris extrusa]
MLTNSPTTYAAPADTSGGLVAAVVFTATGKQERSKNTTAPSVNSSVNQLFEEKLSSEVQNSLDVHSATVCSCENLSRSIIKATMYDPEIYLIFKSSE